MFDKVFDKNETPTTETPALPFMKSNFINKYFYLIEFVGHLLEAAEFMFLIKTKLKRPSKVEISFIILFSWSMSVLRYF